MSTTATIRDMDKNGLLYQPTTIKEMSDKKTSLFHDFLEELQITSIMCTVQEASYATWANTNAMYRQRNAKQEKGYYGKAERIGEVNR